MSLLFLEEFFFLCKKAGFKNLGDVNDYMVENNINYMQLYHELDALCFPEFINI